MSLTPEWNRRVEAWKDELPRHFYQPLGKIPLEGFVTLEQLTPETALKKEFYPMPAGIAWGGKWEYGWFRGEFTLPEAARGKRIVIKPEAGAESAVYLDGQAAGAVDRAHFEILAVQEGTPGTHYQVLIEAYAGHGPRVYNGGPIHPGRVTVPEPPAAQCTVGNSTFGVWEESLYQLWLDAETLWQTRNSMDPESLRVAEIDAALREFTLNLDFEQPLDGVRREAADCRERLAKLLECRNGSTAPVHYTFGHSHIDVAWLWPLQETVRKCGRTFSTQLALMKQYPEYLFLQSQPHLYQMTKEHHPMLYQEIRQAVAAGRFIPEGGMWVEADTHVTSGESLIRQFLHGKKFFREEFNLDNELCWLPDVFGYTGALPQILQGCGIRYFATAKIFWNYNGGEPFPYNTFRWKGIDGTEILSHMMNDYNARTSPTHLVQRWQQRVQKDGIRSRLYPFGHGDGGGGATRDHLEYLRRCADLEGIPRTRMTSPVEFFKDLEAERENFPVFTGEIYLGCHRGTYTTQARTKRGNRKCEFTLREAEMWGAAAALKGFDYPADRLDELWKKVLLNQFHDVLPGSSIARVYAEAEAEYDTVLEASKQMAREAMTALASPGEGEAAVFNSLSWERISLIHLPKGWIGALDSEGQPVPVQTAEEGALAEVCLPPAGWVTLKNGTGRGVENTLLARTDLLENTYLRVTLDAFGGIISIYDKESRQELAAGTCNRLILYKDVPTRFDAWDIDSMALLCPAEDGGEPAEAEVLSRGPLEARIRITRKLRDSRMVQEISLRRDSRRLDFETRIDWQETHKLLKVEFPTMIQTEEALHEIQFGHLRRPTHASRVHDAERFEVPQQKWTALAEEGRGVAVLNDCKYGVGTHGGTIALTLLKSSLAPDMGADRGVQEFTYSFTCWNGSFRDSGLVREAYDLNVPAQVCRGTAGTAGGNTGAGETAGAAGRRPAAAAGS
ncbi:MAG TPA: alpha-mannosidase, partial [Clostridiales bacterium]|nr:alpha-mannosidase [Clostridiales bacterium]